MKNTLVPYSYFIQVPGPSRSHTSFQEHHSQDIIENVNELLPRFSIQEDYVKENGVAQDGENSDDQAAVPGTPPPPPPKRARYIFKRCFQDTFNSQMLPGYDEVLAEDSDDEFSKRT
jgi:hypothetical protein